MENKKSLVLSQIQDGLENKTMEIIVENDKHILVAQNGQNVPLTDKQLQIINEK